MRLIAVASFVASFSLVAGVSADSPLSSFDFTGTGATAAGPFTSFSPFVSYGDPSGMNPLGYMNNAPITLLDILQGVSYEFSGDLAGFAAAMTDGINTPIYVGFTTAGGTGDFDLTSESGLLTSGPVVGAPDLAGYTVTRIRVIGTSFQQLAGGAFEAGFNATIYGDPVPAPGAAALLAIAASCAVRRRR